MDVKEAISKGFVWFCMECNKVYREQPTRRYEDGHGGWQIEMCRCGCDLFGRLDGLENK